MTGNGDTGKLMLMDGGTNVPDGIPSLIQKRVCKIVHVHFDLAFDQKNPLKKKPGFLYAENHNSTNLNEWMSKLGFVGSVDAYFGIGPACSSYAMNKIFDDGYYHMKTLQSNLDSLFKADNPLVTTLENIYSFE